MTNLERAAKLIAEDYRQEAEELECDTMREYMKVMQMDAEDAKAEFVSVLQAFEIYEGFAIYFTDDGEIESESGNFHTFKELLKAVRNYRFN